MEFLTKLCYLVEEHGGGEGRWPETQCAEELWEHCGHHLTEPLLEAVRLGSDKTNLTECLSSAYGLTPALVAAAAPPKVRPRPYLPRESPPPGALPGPHLLLLLPLSRPNSGEDMKDLLLCYWRSVLCCLPHQSN